MKRTALWLSMACLAAVGFSGCDDEGAACTESSDCDFDDVCGPNARCQAGAVGDPCESESHCMLDLTCEGSQCDVSPCQGTANPCSLNASTFTCEAAPGCYDTGSCSGLAVPCGAFGSRFTCDDQPGCYWSSFDDECDGVPLSCSTRLFEDSCEDTSGCIWNPQCTGDARPCDTLPREMCLDQPGCNLN